MRIARMTVVALATAAAIVACSDSNGPGARLTGNYVLDSLKVGTDPTLMPPIATGSLDFTAPSSFAAAIVLQPPAVPKADSTIPLSGTYTLKGADSIFLTVYGGAVTIPGTEVQTGNKLVLDVLVPPGLLGSGVTPTRVFLAWHK